MKRKRFFQPILLALLCSVGCVLCADGPAPSADEIIRKTMQQAQRAERTRPPYAYSKISVVEEIDGKGHTKDRKEKVYDARVEAGLTFLKLVKINGQALSASALKKENDKENEQRQKISQKKSARGGDDRENFLTPELVGRYKFRIQDTPVINGRATYLLTFAPKSKDLPVNEITDHLVNNLFGKVWIDAQEFEIAKIEVRLQSEVALWAGVLGNLKKFTFVLERTRLNDGVWFNRVSSGDFEGRKLIESVRIKTHSESKDFAKLDKPKAVH